MKQVKLFEQFVNEAKTFYVLANSMGDFDLKDGAYILGKFKGPNDPKLKKELADSLDTTVDKIVSIDDYSVTYINDDGENEIWDMAVQKSV